ncbi:MAG TPA: hypothetical protein VIU38_04820 [Anaerolineales bacterium]
MAAGESRSAAWMSWLCLVVGLVTLMSQVAFWAGTFSDNLPYWLYLLRQEGRAYIVPLGLLAIPLALINVMLGLMALERDPDGTDLARAGVVLSAMALSFGPLVITGQYFSG